MKWKIASYMTLGCVFAFGAINGLRSVAQQPGNLQGRTQDRIPPVSNFPLQSGYADLYGQLMRGVPGGNGNPTGPRFVPQTRTIKNPDGTEVTVTEMRFTEDMRKTGLGSQELRDAVSKLRANDASESDKKAARDTIEKFLKDEFERDQKNRKEHVERLEEQISNLRKQLDKRQESQSKIIALRMQLLENDAEGLSFPEGFNELQNMNYGNPREGGFSPAPPTSQPYVGEGKYPPVYPGYPQPGVYPQSNPRY